MKKQGFWFCNQPFKGCIFFLPHAPALLFVWDNYRPPERNLSFKLLRMSPVLRSHSLTSGQQAYEGPCEASSAGISSSQVICCNHLSHKDFFTRAQTPFSTFLGSNWNHGEQLPNKYIVYFCDTIIT